MQEAFRRFFFEMFLLKFKLLEIYASIYFISASCMSKSMQKSFNKFVLNILAEFGKITKIRNSTASTPKWCCANKVKVSVSCIFKVPIRTKNCQIYNQYIFQMKQFTLGLYVKGKNVKERCVI